MDGRQSVVLIFVLLPLCFISFIVSHEVIENQHDHYSFSALATSVKSKNSLTFNDVQRIFQKLRFENCSKTGRKQDCNRCLSPADLGLTEASVLNATEFAAKAVAIVYYLMPEQNPGLGQLSAVCNASISLPGKLFDTITTKYSANRSLGVAAQDLDGILEAINSTLGRYLTEKKCISAESIIEEVHESSGHEEHGHDEEAEALDEHDFEKASASIVFHLYQGYCISDSHNHEHSDKLPKKTFFLNELFGSKPYLGEDDLKKITSKLGIASPVTPAAGGDPHAGHDHKRKRRAVDAPTTATPHTQSCFNLDQMFDIFGINHAVGTSKLYFKELCPAFIQQLMSGSCGKKPTVSSGDKNMSKIWGYGFLAVTIISLASLVGVATIPFIDKKFYKKVLAVLVALAVGTLSGDGVLHLIPHAFGLHEHKEEAAGAEHDHNSNLSSKSFIWKALVVLMSIYLFYIFEILMHFGLKNKIHSHSHVDIELPGPDTHHQSCERRQCSKLEHHEGPEPAMDADPPVVDHHSDIVLQNVGPSPCHSPSFHNCVQVFENYTHSETESDESLLENVKYLGGVDRSENASNGKPKLEKKESLMTSLSKRSVFTSKDNEKQEEPTGISSVAWMIIIGDTIHNISDGLAIGAAFSEGGASGFSGGISTSIAVFCHELPHELGDFAVLLSAGMSIKMALLANFLSACSCYIGLIIGILIGQQPEVRLWIFAVAGGMFIYVALVDMLPDLMHSESLQTETLKTFILQSFGFLMGISIMLVIALFEEDLMAIKF